MYNAGYNCFLPNEHSIYKINPYGSNFIINKTSLNGLKRKLRQIFKWQNER